MDIFNIGDTVICINTHNYKDKLSIFNKYVVTYTTKRGEFISFKNHDHEIAYQSRFFVSLVDFRKQKIEKICSRLDTK